MKAVIIIFIFSLSSFNIFSPLSKTVRIEFKISPEINFSENGSSEIKTQNGNPIILHTLKFYISNCKLSRDDKTVYAENNSYHLIDFSNEKALNFNLEIPLNSLFDGITFDLGIDSTTSVSGAFGGDLDPVNGMYWTWQSGYINFKLEGKYLNPDGHQQELEFHLGGYQYPYNNLQSINLKLVTNESLVIKLDLAQFLNGINVEETNHIMSPGAAAQKLSGELAKCFRIN